MLYGMIRDRKVVTNGKVVDVPRRIYFFRTSEGLTQQELAKKLGVTQGCVCAWEKGRSTPDNDMIHKICKVLSIPVDRFVLGIG